MKKFISWIKWLVLSLIGIIVILGIVGLLLPRTYHIERSIVINATNEDIYPQIANLRNWENWSVWNTKVDPTMVSQFSGAEEGEGARQTWTGDKMGKGSLTITQADPATGIWYELVFEENFKSPGSIMFEQAGSATRVVWGMSGDMGNNVFGRYMLLIMDRMVGDDFENGLSGLKKISESQANQRKKSGSAEGE